MNNYESSNGTPRDNEYMWIFTEHYELIEQICYPLDYQPNIFQKYMGFALIMFTILENPSQ